MIDEMSGVLSREQIETNKETFLGALRAHVKRPGVEDLIDWLEKSDFFIAPASTRFHGNYDGGLCEHSLNVFKCMMELREKYPDFDVPEESAVLSSLLHDACKVRVYKKGFRNRKNEDGRWEQYQTYEFDERFPGGHGEKSAFIIQQFVKLLPEEYLAVRWHMAGFDSAVKGGDRAFNAACEQSKLVPMLNLADLEASHMLEDTIVW